MKIKYYGAEAEKYHQYLLDNYSRLPIPKNWSKSIILELDIGWSKKSNSLVFPHYDENGLVIAVRQHKGMCIGDGSCKWYPRHYLSKYDKSNDLHICEGEKDCDSLLSVDKQAISPTLGALSIPADLTPLESFKNIIIMYDNDEAGNKGSLKMAQAIKSAFPNINVRIAKWN